MTKITTLDPDKPWQEHRFPKQSDTCLIHRFGAIGDMIQMSSILPGLKKQGWRICVNTTPQGMAIVKNDPHIDEFLIQEDDQVPNAELGDYWKREEKAYGKFINLAESVEGSLLALEGRKQWKWHPAFRHLLMDVDYLEATHAIAEVPYKPAAKFYPTSAEKKLAISRRKKLKKKNYVIMLSAAGSSVHKIWPYMDSLIARMLILHNDVRFIIVGDALSQIAEIGWEKEPRVLRRSGKWSVRDSLAMAQQCDLVIAPETGIANAVAFGESVSKILLLSHSSKKNLGWNWKNAAILEPYGAECYPCHALHYGFHTCKKDEETGCSVCMSAHDIDTVFEWVNHHYLTRKYRK